MSWNPTSWFVSARTRAPHERPREYNDPSKHYQLDHFYSYARWPHHVRTAVSLVVLGAILAFVGFIVFNLVFS